MPSFIEAFPELAIAPDKNGRVAKVDGTAARKMDKLVTELKARINRQGYKKATVISLHVFPIETHMGYSGKLVIPGRKMKDGVEQPFVRYVVNQYLIQPHEAAEGERYPEAILPVEIASEFIREMRQVQEDDGEVMPDASVGVFWYEGDSERYPQALFDRAESLLDKWYEQLFEEAENNWSKSQNRREISERSKDAARMMLKKGRIDQLPDWTRKSVKTDDKEKSTLVDCPMCAAKLGQKAAFCPTCKTMINPKLVKELRPDIYYNQRPEERPAPKETK